jgi:hypothetical protein
VRVYEQVYQTRGFGLMSKGRRMDSNGRHKSQKLTPIIARLFLAIRQETYSNGWSSL